MLNRIVGIVRYAVAPFLLGILVDSAHANLAPGSEVPEYMLIYYMKHSSRERDCILSFFRDRTLSKDDRCKDVNGVITYLFTVKKLDIKDDGVIADLEIKIIEYLIQREINRSSHLDRK